MIKAAGKHRTNGRPLIILGLSHKNLKKLKQGLPIHITADPLGFVGDIVIFTGETEDKMAAELRAHMDIGHIEDHRGKPRH